MATQPKYPRDSTVQVHWIRDDKITRIICIIDLYDPSQKALEMQRRATDQQVWRQGRRQLVTDDTYKDTYETMKRDLR